MTKHLLSLFAMLLYVTGCVAQDSNTGWSVGSGANDKANITWIGFTVPTTNNDGQTVSEVSLSNIHLCTNTSSGEQKTAYMVISSTKEIGGRVGISTNAPVPQDNALVEYTFDGVTLTAGATYYMFFTTSSTSITSCGQRIAISNPSGNYGPKVGTANAEQTWEPYFKVNYTPGEIPADNRIEGIFSSTYGEKWIRLTNCKNGNYVWSATDSKLGTAQVDLSNSGQLFCFVGSQSTGFKIYSALLGSGVALKADNTNDGTAPKWVAPASASTWYVDVTYADAAGSPGYGITTQNVSSGGNIMSLNMYAGNGGDVKFYSVDDAGSRWQFTTLNTLTVTQSVPGVTCTYTWGNQTKTGTEVVFASEVAVEAKSIQVRPIGGYTASMSMQSWDGSHNATATNTLTPDFFNSSANDITHWVRITNVRSNYAIYADEATALHSHVTASTEDELFAFIGTADGFKIYSKTQQKYFGSTDANEDTPVTAVAETRAREYTLVPCTGNYAGYAIAPVAAKGQSLNMHGGDGKDIKYYRASDEGSTWYVNEIGGPLTINVLLAGNVLPINNKVGSLSISYNGKSSNTRFNLDGATEAGPLTTVNLTAPKGALITLSEGQGFTGYDFSVTYGGTTTKEVSLGEIPSEGATATVTFTANNRQNLFYSIEHGRPYRIPAITKARNGQLLAISDDRFCGADIGYGRVDLVYKVSSDNGLTWSTNDIMLAQGDGVNSSNTCGYGDAAVCADRTSDRIMMMCVSAPNGGTCWTERQRGVITWATPGTDGQWIWEKPVDIKDELMALLPSDRINYFVGSGKISQSRIVKKGDYYRVYVALWTTGSDGLTNYVVYSDEFGKPGSWHLLGRSTVRPVPGGDEPKAEELPDGRVVVSGRKHSGRYFNIFTFSDDTYTTGSWSTAVASNEVSGGLAWGGNSTNGEIMVVQAKHKDTGRTVPIVLQSAPAGGARSLVSIWYKILDSPAKYRTPTIFSQNWTKGMQVSDYNSGYSTMCMQADGRIAFFFEDSKSGAGYDMVYLPISISELKGLEDYIIEPDSSTAGISSTSPSYSGPSAIYDLTGRRLRTLTSGICIADNRKILVR